MSVTMDLHEEQQETQPTTVEQAPLKDDVDNLPVTSSESSSDEEEEEDDEEEAVQLRDSTFFCSQPMQYPTGLGHLQNGSHIEQETAPFNPQVTIDYRNKFQIFSMILKQSLRLSNRTISEEEPAQDSGQNSNQTRRVSEERRRRVWCEPCYLAE